MAAAFIQKKGEANVLDRALFLIEALFGAFTYLSESKLGNRSDLVYTRSARREAYGVSYPSEKLRTLAVEGHVDFMGRK